MLEVVELACERARLGSATPMGDVARDNPEAPIRDAQREIDKRPALYAMVRSGACYEALVRLADELRGPKQRA